MATRTAPSAAAPSRSRRNLRSGALALVLDVREAECHRVDAGGGDSRGNGVLENIHVVIRVLQRPVWRQGGTAVVQLLVHHGVRVFVHGRAEFGTV